MVPFPHTLVVFEALLTTALMGEYVDKNYANLHGAHICSITHSLTPQAVEFEAGGGFKMPASPTSPLRYPCVLTIFHPYG